VVERLWVVLRARTTMRARDRQIYQWGGHSPKTPGHCYWPVRSLVIVRIARSTA